MRSSLSFSAATQSVRTAIAVAPFLGEAFRHIDAVTGKPVSTARLLIEFDLPPNAIVERQKTISLRLRKIHHVNLAAEREAYLMG